ncbi:MAG: SocA family protein [Planctomycetes bacterium]|nr:SocA family protein [Planctomycetota bacterium]
MTKSSDPKLKELILYIAKRSEMDDRFGAVKLNKLLWYTDFLSYLRRGKSITGQEYFALNQGPAPRRLMPVRSALTRDGSVRLESREYFGRKQQRVVALRDPDLSIFDGEEMAFVDHILEIYLDLDGSELSEMSHRMLGWKVARNEETIPYATALVEARTPSMKERERGQRLEDRAREVLLHGSD